MTEGVAVASSWIKGGSKESKVKRESESNRKERGDLKNQKERKNRNLTLGLVSLRSETNDFRIAYEVQVYIEDLSK